MLRLREHLHEKVGFAHVVENVGDVARAEKSSVCFPSVNLADATREIRGDGGAKKSP